MGNGRKGLLQTIDNNFNDPGIRASNIDLPNIVTIALSRQTK